jgi:hypothetical protein
VASAVAHFGAGVFCRLCYSSIFSLLAALGVAVDVLAQRRMFGVTVPLDELRRQLLKEHLVTGIG